MARPGANIALARDIFRGHYYRLLKRVTSFICGPRHLVKYSWQALPRSHRKRITSLTQPGPADHLPCWRLRDEPRKTRPRDESDTMSAQLRQSKPGSRRRDRRGHMHQLRLRLIRSCEQYAAPVPDEQRRDSLKAIRTTRKILRFRQEPLHDHFQSAGVEQVTEC